MTMTMTLNLILTLTLTLTLTLISGSFVMVVRLFRLARVFKMFKAPFDPDPNPNPL